jgi:hypothetical protein
MFARMCGKRNPHAVGRNVNEFNYYGKQNGDSLKKLKIDRPYDPTIPRLGIYPEECESGYNKGTEHLCFLQQYSQYLRYGNSQGAPLLIYVLDNVAFIYNGILFSRKEGWNFSFTGKWMER